MAIRYFITRGVNPKGDNSIKLFQGRFRQKEVVPFDRLIDMISEQCSASHADVEGIVRVFLDDVVNEACQGHIVRVGRLGSFKMTLRTMLVPNEDEWSKSKIKGANLVFTPGALLNDAMAGADFQADGYASTIDPNEAE